MPGHRAEPGPAGRPSSRQARLARLGFVDVARADGLLDSPAMQALLAALPADAVDLLLDDLGDAADPDQALVCLIRVVDSAAGGDGTPDAAAAEATALRGAVAAAGPLRRRLIAVLGTSLGLADHLVRHPGQWRALTDDWVREPLDAAAVRGALLRAVGADPTDEVPVARGAGPEVLADLRVAYRRLLLSLAALDLVGDDGGPGLPVEEVGAALAALADAALDAAVAVARAGLPPDAPPCRFAVIGMGKCGGRELNYVSDVDVIFVAEPFPGGDEVGALATGTKLAAGVIRACSATTAEGSLWEVDAALRPEGRSGALVRTLASHVAYYQRWASTWEYQALLKARPAAGDRALGAAYVDAVLPFIWAAADRSNFVEDVQAMRRRVEQHVPSRDAERQLKLGPGGLRDVEFAVQLLQLVHGRSDVMLRSSNTLEALESLSTWGYVGREDAASLATAYRFLRRLEHRIQLHRLRRTHVVPDDDADLRRLGRSLGFRVDPVDDLVAAFRRHRREVRRLHEKLFYRPLLNAVARLPAGDARLTPEAAEQRLVALGYVDPAGALRHIEALTSGMARRAAIQRTLLPVLLGWFADAPDPDAGLLAFRRLSDSLGATPWYLRLLRDESAAAERMAAVLATSRYASGLLLRAPEAVRMLADDGELVPRSQEALETEALSAATRYDDPELAVAAVRALRRRELLRVSVADLSGLLDIEAVGAALSEVTAATVVGALQAAVRSVGRSTGGKLPTRLAIIAMGRFGGRELGYASDADVIFVHDPLPGADERAAADAALAVANELRRLLAVPSPDPPLVIDADLRPEGRAGALVRTLSAYAAYYARWSETWESQALLRASFVAGDPELGQRFLQLANPLRWPDGGVDEEAVREIRRLKARMEAERLPRGADPAMHTKLGRGGLSDVEWAVQLMQLRYAGQQRNLQTTGTLAALRAAEAAGLFDDQDAEALLGAWRIASRVRNAAMLVRGRPVDSVPSDLRELRAVAHVLGYGPSDSGRLLDDYRRLTRRARSVVERVFYQ
ncbi:MAG: bifunctional [glutamine synthetase] adenylyltransferase/[glutamine synthetase]-adenylyl-L-tyrosine phosphorylase [Actinomycetota bacterium]|nr:MAG: bifunctional [glutamine synthetase] adenylyltransferase/[glutamine synthetase]-adenylyl-L-tyrosine phosphorylase [Actinomycetota bacterium]